MNIKDLIKILFLLIFISLCIYLIIYLNNVQKNSSYFDNTPIVVNPVEQGFKNKCTNVRTPCDPRDPNACNKSCDENELTCVNLDNLNPQGGQQFNGGGAVCLPDIPPDLKCDTTRGGVLVWTGYAEVDDEAWSCLCMFPDRFNGADCSQTAPGFCTGGTLDTSKLNGSFPDDSLCICPSGTTKLANAFTNLPFCAPNNLAGNLYEPPDWRNIYFNPVFLNTSGNNIPDDGSLWASYIENELFFPNILDSNSSASFQSDVRLILTSVSKGDTNTSLSRGYLSQNTANQLAVAACKPNLNIKPNTLIDYPNQLPVNYTQQIGLLNFANYTYYQGAAFAS